MMRYSYFVPKNFFQYYYGSNQESKRLECKLQEIRPRISNHMKLFLPEQHDCPESLSLVRQNHPKNK